MSAASRATGAAKEPKSPGEGKSERPPTSLTVVLDGGRWRYLGWSLVGAALGVALIARLGMVGKVAGALFLAIAAANGWRAYRAFRLPAGTFRISDAELAIPPAQWGEDLFLAAGELRHCYFFRRAVPWGRAGPILVLETANRAFRYPRDWFHSDADQRRVAHALSRRLHHGGAEPVGR